MHCLVYLKWKKLVAAAVWYGNYISILFDGSSIRRAHTIVFIVFSNIEHWPFAGAIYRNDNIWNIKVIWKYCSSSKSLRDSFIDQTMWRLFFVIKMFSVITTFQILGKYNCIVLFAPSPHYILVLQPLIDYRK